MSIQVYRTSEGRHRDASGARLPRTRFFAFRWKSLFPRRRMSPSIVRERNPIIFLVSLATPIYLRTSGKHIFANFQASFIFLHPRRACPAFRPRSINLMSIYADSFYGFTILTHSNARLIKVHVNYRFFIAGAGLYLLPGNGRWINQVYYPKFIRELRCQGGINKIYRGITTLFIAFPMPLL